VGVEEHLSEGRLGNGKEEQASGQGAFDSLEEECGIAFGP